VLETSSTVEALATGMETRVSVLLPKTVPRSVVSPSKEGGGVGRM